MGKCYSDYIQKFDTSRALEDAVLNIDSTSLASEIKCVIINGQNVLPSQSPCNLVAARPQTTNSICDTYTDCIRKQLEGQNDYTLLNKASDRLTSEVHIIKEQTISYMKGESNTVELMNCNRLFKANKKSDGFRW